MLSPSSCTATCSASKLPSSSGPTAWASALAQRSSGACQSGLVTKAAVGEPWLLSATKVRPGCITDMVVGVAVTIGSQPITRSALAMSTLVV